MKEPMPLSTLLGQMQDDAQLWGDLLHVSGGVLEIPKCNYYVMQWQFHANGKLELNKKEFTPRYTWQRATATCTSLFTKTWLTKCTRCWARGNPHSEPK
jgi:hypothetical protein